MNNNFDARKMAETTPDAFSAGAFNSWVRVCRTLDEMGFNCYEAEAILRSKWMRICRDERPDLCYTSGSGKGKYNSTCIETYLSSHGYIPRSTAVNALVLASFDELVANAEGVPCRKGMMPGNPEGGEILVPAGTSLSCDPTSETYWSM